MQRSIEISGRKFAKHIVAARINGVHIRTLDRWTEAGIIPKPVVINGHKYHDVEALAAAGMKRA